MSEPTGTRGTEVPTAGGEVLGGYDVCIVGTGPAGATLASELGGSGLCVVVLESGVEARRPENDELNEVENIGHPREPDQWEVRNRIVGGSSATWGGRCAPFDAIDFEQRSWVPMSGWPIDEDALHPYLVRSAPHLGLAAGTGFSGDDFWAFAERQRPPMPDPSRVLPFFWQYSRDDDESYPYEYMRFGRNLAGRLAPNVELITGATALRVETDETGGTARSVTYAGADGDRHTVEAKVVVLCAGGIENARILLESNQVASAGLGNQHDLVGRTLMDHPRGPIASFDVADAATLQRRLGRAIVKGHLFRPGFRLSPDAQRSEHLLNASVWIGETVAADDPLTALRGLLRGRSGLGRHAISVLKNLPLLARGARQYLAGTDGVGRKLEALTLECMVEQVPDLESRITLSERKDRLGARIPVVDWRVHAEESRTMRHVARALVEEFARIGLPAPVLADWILADGEMPASFVDVAHPTGTTRMATDPALGVVDENCAVHGVAGLYVAGSSVFPTAGHCNPTQMIVAMAIRLADHLRETMPIRASASTSHDASATVLLTGATGRIGRVVLEDLVDRGYRVRATTAKAAPRSTSSVEWRRFDFFTAEPGDYDELVAGCDAVLHLAAEIGELERMTRVNAAATRHLAESAERSKVRSFCYTSTVSVYGSGRRTVMHEDAPVLTATRDIRSEYWALDYVRMYGRSKLAGELAIRAIAATTRYTILRPAVVVDIAELVGIREWGLSKRVLAAHRHAHHVYVRDVSEALLWAMQRGLDGTVPAGQVDTFNLAEDEYPEPTHAAFLKRAFAASGDRRYRVPAVPGLFDWIHDFVRFHSLPLRNPLWRLRFPNARLISAGYRFRFGMAHATSLALRSIAEESGAKSR